MTPEQAVCQRFAELHPHDAAQVLERLPAGEVAALFDGFEAGAAAAVLGHMMPTAAVEVLGRMAAGPAAALVTALKTDVASALLRRLDEAPREAILAALEPAEAGPLRTLLRYPEGTAGALLDPRAVALPDDVSVAEARLRLERAGKATMVYLYVIDRDQRLVGVLTVSELLAARSTERLAAIMQTPVVALASTADRAVIVAHPAWRDYQALPVVDERGAFLGAVRVQTLRRLEEEAALGRRREDALATVFALGELYWLGVSGFLEGFASTVARTAGVVPRTEDRHGT